MEAIEGLRRADDAESRGFVAGFLLGAVVGAILAIVFSPWKGEAARELVAERAVQLKERAADLVGQVRGDGAPEGYDAPAIEREIGGPTSAG